MKRVLALFLTVMLLAALFPASIVAKAETVTKEGFYLVNWGRDFDTGDHDYIYHMPYTWINSSKFDGSSASINIGVYFGEDYSTSNIELAAAELYDEFNKRPAGTRYINLSALATVFKHCVKDVIDMEDGVRLVADWLDRFLAEYKRIGGKLDGIAIDLEYNSYTSHYLQSNFCVKTSNGGDPKNLDVLQDIVRNERVYQKIIRPQLVEYEKQGLFKFYTKDINPKTGLPDDLSIAIGPEYNSRVPIPVSEITTVNRYDDNGGDANSRSTWSWVMSNYLAECITRASYDPMVKYYPDAILSDYSTADVYSWHKSMSTTGGATGTGVKAGNASNGVYYGSQFSEYFWATYSNSKTRQLYYKPASYNKAVFDPTDKFTRVLYDVNNFKRVLASTRDKMGEEAHVNVWVPGYNYSSDTKSYGSSPYFAELMYHLGMANPEPFLGYILPQDAKGVAMEEIRQVSDEILAELTRVAGASDRKAIETPMSWNEDYIISGMYAGGRNIWRITPNTDKIPVDEFKINNYAPTFSVNGVTVTFPQGRIIQDAGISEIGTCGYWIETPANVTPVVTADAERYAKAPSFLETFSNYNTGAFTGSSASMIETTSGRPDTYWTVKGTAEIKEINGDKAVALTGTTTLTNSKMVANITAGDYYAKQQAWEVTVTLPGGNYGEIVLLSCDKYDRGIKIAGGKVYYDQSGSYQEMSGVTLSAGTYIVKRELDLRTDGKYISNYIICDVAGNRLGGAENIPMTTVTVPFTEITVSTANAAEAVLVDDYKLYPQGVTTSLDIYEADRGRKLTNYNTVRSADTGYRFTWMNASNQYKVARIYDAKTGTILKKIEMAPGMDGVVSELVRIDDSQQIQFAVNISDETAPSRPDYNNGNFRWTAVSESIGLATGAKPAGGNDNVQEDTPPATEDAGGEGDNIFDVVDGTGDPNNGSGGDQIAPGEDSGNTEVPGETGDSGDGTPNEPGKKGLSGGMIALIVVLSLAVLAGGAAAYIFVLKPDLAAKLISKFTKNDIDE